MCSIFILFHFSRKSIIVNIGVISVIICIIYIIDTIFALDKLVMLILVVENNSSLFFSLSVSMRTPGIEAMLLKDSIFDIEVEL